MGPTRDQVHGPTVEVTTGRLPADHEGTFVMSGVLRDSFVGRRDGVSLTFQSLGKGPIPVGKNACYAQLLVADSADLHDAMKLGEGNLLCFPARIYEPVYLYGLHTIMVGFFSLGMEGKACPPAPCVAGRVSLVRRPSKGATGSPEAALSSEGRGRRTRESEIATDEGVS